MEATPSKKEKSAPEHRQSSLQHAGHEVDADVLNPIQWRCRGMDREGLKRDFGDRLVFHGGVDNQYTLPFGTPEEVRQEVMDNYNILGAGGGYILAPCHNIQSVTPPENIVAMYEAGYENGWR